MSRSLHAVKNFGSRASPVSGNYNFPYEYVRLQQRTQIHGSGGWTEHVIMHQAKANGRKGVGYSTR
jgi:hypothetical protein